MVDTLIEPRPAHESASGESGALLRVENLSKHYPIRRGVLSRVVGHQLDLGPSRGSFGAPDPHHRR